VRGRMCGLRNTVLHGRARNRRIIHRRRPRQDFTDSAMNQSDGTDEREHFWSKQSIARSCHFRGSAAWGRGRTTPPAGSTAGMSVNGS